MKRIVLRAELRVCLSQKITGMCQNKRPKNAKNSVLETLKIKNFLGGACPQTPLGGSRLRRSPCPPQLKQPGDATANNKKVLIFGGRKLPELELPGFLGILMLFVRPVISRLYCCRRRFNNLSLGGALFVFAVVFVSVLLQIFIVVASLEVTFECR